MKRTFSYVLPAIPCLIILPLLFIAGGCSKTNNSSSSTGPGGGGVSTGQSMSASINGTVFQPSLIAAYDDHTNINVAGLVLNAGDSSEFVVIFPDNTAVDTVLNFSIAQISYTDSKRTFDFESSILPSHGTIQITGRDQAHSVVAGTFSGVLYNKTNDSVVVKNGQFNSVFTVL